MKPLQRGLATITVLAFLWPTRAEAYRPFDQTDADLAAPGEFEFEFGPAQALRTQGQLDFAIPIFGGAG